MKRLSAALTAILILMFALSITAYADVEEDVEPDPPPPSRIIIVDHMITDGGLTAGEQSTVVFLLRNTGRDAAVSSVLITGSIDQTAPMVFIGANQDYVSRIGPGAQAVVKFDFYVQDIDLTLVRNVAANFMIEYFDESSWTTRVNNVSIRLNVTNDTRATVSEEDMVFPVHEVSNLEELMFSAQMQEVYTFGLIICIAGVVLILLYKLLKRFVDWKGGKTNV